MYSWLKMGLLIFCLLFITGCAGLSGIIGEIEGLDAQQEITSVTPLIKDLVNSPWDNMLTVGIGYALALIRRKYKISKGAK